MKNKDRNARFPMHAVVAAAAAVLFLTASVSGCAALAADSKTIAKAGSAAVSKADSAAVKLVAAQTKDTVYAVLSDDFDGDGSVESFVLTGSKSSEEQDGLDGVFWYAANGKAAVLKKDVVVGDPGKAASEAKDRSNGLLTDYDLGSARFAAFDSLYTTCALTILYGVKDGKAYETALSGKGCAEAPVQGSSEITVNFDRYDGMLDTSGGQAVLVEHTQKPYYFYWDGAFHEYGGTELTKKEFRTYGGADAALAAVSADGGCLTDILSRENGVIELNYAVPEDDGSVRFAFKAYRLKGKTLIEDTGLTNEGTYQAAAIPSIARYRGKSSGRTADARFAVLSYDYWENGGEMTQSTLTRNKCDAAGRLVSSDTLHSDDNYSDDSTENYYGVHTEYEYDKNGNLTAQTAYNADGTKYWGNCRTAAFDSHGNEIKTEDFDDSGNPDGGNTYTYKYDAAGNVLTKNMYYEDELVLVYKYTYDKAGHMLTQKNYRDGKLEYSEKDTWNKAGRKTAVSVIYYTDTQDLASGDGVDTVYTYDKAGHLLKAESTCTGSRKGESEGSEAYTYDDETGDCIESMNEEPVATSYDYNIYAQIDLAQ